MLTAFSSSLARVSAVCVCLCGGVENAGPENERPRQFSPARRYASACTSYGPVSVSVGVCLSVCLSVTSRCSINRDERINVVFGMWASFDQS